MDSGVLFFPTRDLHACRVPSSKGQGGEGVGVWMPAPGADTGPTQTDYR